MKKIQKQIFFIDTNVLAYWILGKGEVLSSMLNRFNMSNEFLNLYQRRYQDSIDFINKLIEIKNKIKENEFYISNFAVNELFSVVKDELRSILLFKKGVPISRWKDQLYSPEIEPKDYEFIYEAIFKSLDTIFSKIEEKNIELITESSPEDHENYYEIYSSILFLIRDAKTQDATLLTTAILYGADYFVTQDERLIKSAKKTIKEIHETLLIRPKSAMNILHAS